MDHIMMNMRDFIVKCKNEIDSFQNQIDELKTND